MEKIKIYANYGVLAHEKQTIYTYGAEHPHATYSETMEVEIPEGFEVSESVTGKPLITPPGCDYTYEINEILSHRADEPIFLWVDQDKKTHWKKLK